MNVILSHHAQKYWSKVAWVSLELGLPGFSFILSWFDLDMFTKKALHYGNIFEYLSLWSEVHFLNIQKSKKIQKIRKPH